MAMLPLGSSPIADLTLEEKAGQLLMAHFHGSETTEEARALVQDLHVGGIIYYKWANELSSKEQVTELSRGLQDLAKIPLLIAVDQEGGLVTRLDNGFSQFPGNMALGMTGDRELSRASARICGDELRAAGINMNLAPVVDVNANPRNPVIGIRSFGSDPVLVTELAQAALDGYREAGIIPVVKHFPGHGDVLEDSHVTLPVVKKSLEELEQVDLYPFAKLAQSTPAVMTGHILVPALDAEKCATLSYKTLNYLRETLDYKGLIVTDSLVMQGLLAGGSSVEECAIEAINAGCDLLILGGKQLIGNDMSLELTLGGVSEIHRAIVEAVRVGRIAQERLDNACQRVLALKERINFPINGLYEESEIAKKIATGALRCLSQQTWISNLSDDVTLIAPQIMQGEIQKSGWRACRSLVFYSGLNPDSEERQRVVERCQGKQPIVVLSYNAWKNPGQIALIQTLLSEKSDVILAIVRDPIDAELFKQAPFVYATYSPTAISLSALRERLQKPIE